jgi:hypothetical protein
VLVGRIKSSDVTGLRVRSPYHARCCRSGSRAAQVSLGFFDDVHVPEECLQEPSELCVRPAAHVRLASDASFPCSDEAEGLWRWRYEGQEEMFMDTDEEVRVRVKSLRFPERPASAEALALLSPLEGGMASAEGMAFAPMIVEVRPSRACCVQAARMLLHACARRCL